MCGIAAILSLDERQDLVSQIRRMTQALEHRGPDDEGYLFGNTDTGSYVAASGGDTPEEVLSSSYPYSPKSAAGAPAGRDRFNLALSNRRLAVIDLSPAGHQPTCNEDGSIWVVHNGEIYNYREIRQDLIQRGHRFSSNSDTEVILHSYEEWATECVDRFNGMWAFCLWDSRNRRLFCSRDRFGIKPLHYLAREGTYVFASEIRAIHAAIGERLPLRAQAVFDYLTYGYTDHTAETFYKGILQIPPAHSLLVQQGKARLWRYWNLPDDEERQDRALPDTDEKFLSILEDAVGIRLRSDVPIGSCLSGGLDSSSIVSVAKRRCPDGVSNSEKAVYHAFTAHYPGSTLDEAHYARNVADALGLRMHLVRPEAQGLLENLARVIDVQEEPFGGTSVYAQWCVMQSARREGLRVLLDGQGGDEALAGYPMYYPHLLAGLMKGARVLEFAREIAGRHGRMGYGRARAVALGLFHLLPSGLKSSVRGLFKAGGAELLRRELTDVCAVKSYPPNRYGSPLLSYQYDTIAWSQLPALLRYEDRNSMSFSIETRLPFLDHRLVSYLFRLPDDQKLSRGVSKVLLRRSMRGLVPDVILNRTDKIGFATPEEAWLTGPLSKIIAERFQRRNPASSDYIDPAKVMPLARTPAGGRTNCGLLWRCLNLDLWLENVRGRRL